MCIFLHSRRMKMIARSPVDDNDFSKSISMNKLDHPFIIEIRRALAYCCKIPAESIRSDDIFEDVADMMTWTGWDEVGLILALSIVTGRCYKYDRRLVALPVLTRKVLFGYILHSGIPMNEWINRALPELRKAEITTNQVQ